MGQKCDILSYQCFRLNHTLLLSSLTILHRAAVGIFDLRDDPEMQLCKKERTKFSEGEKKEMGIKPPEGNGV